MASSDRNPNCKVCQDLGIPLPTELGHEVKYEIFYQDCLANAENGQCATCRLLIDAITCPLVSKHLQDNGRSLKKSIQSFSDTKLRIMVVSVRYPGLDAMLRVQLGPPDSDTDDEGTTTFYDMNPFPTLELFTKGPQSRWPSMGQGRAVHPDAASSKVVRMMMSWIKECRKTHHRCRWDKHKQLPDRLLYIGAEREPYLHISTKKDRGFYAALSHCWGGATGLQTTLATIDQFRREIPFERFPKNFQEAIEICRCLGLKYLWIDSLCIIQDSKLDWQEQSAKMADIYSQCDFAVAANAARDSHAGFLRTPGRQLAASKVFRLPWPPSSDGTEKESKHEPDYVYVRELWSQVFTISKHGGFDSTCHVWSDPPDGPSPLSSRGWVLQETMLAPRTLHFCSDEVVWECRTHYRCECMNIPNSDNGRYKSLDPETWMQPWDLVVPEFTSRSLTYQTDKLEAIAGIAKKEMARVEKEKGVSTKYVAGLWVHNLRENLHWRRAQRHRDDSPRDDDTESGDELLEGISDDDPYYGSDLDSDGATRGSDCAACDSDEKPKIDLNSEPIYNPSRRVEPYIAPSWSWACVTGCISLESWYDVGKESLENNADDLELDDIIIDYKYAGPNEFGAVMEGTSLTVIAETFTLHVLPREKADGTYRWEVTKSWPRFLGRILEVDADQGSVNFDDYEYQDARVCYFDADEDEEALKAGDDIFTVVNLTNYTLFLILKEVHQDGETDVCRRVGIMGTWGSGLGSKEHQGRGQRRRVRII